MEEGAGLRALSQRIQATVSRAQAAGDERLTRWSTELSQALAQVTQATREAWSQGEPARVLANAVPYMQAFGHMVLAWTWLDVALSSRESTDANTGRMLACQFFFHYELPKIGAWLQVAARCDSTCADMPEDAF
jgi:butyryl-CoA dehydrogenase